MKYKYTEDDDDPSTDTFVSCRETISNPTHEYKIPCGIRYAVLTSKPFQRYNTTAAPWVSIWAECYENGKFVSGGGHEPPMSLRDHLVSNQATPRLVHHILNPCGGQEDNLSVGEHAQYFVTISIDETLQEVDQETAITVECFEK